MSRMGLEEETGRGGVKQKEAGGGTGCVCKAEGRGNVGLRRWAREQGLSGRYHKLSTFSSHTALFTGALHVKTPPTSNNTASLTE